MGRKSYYQLLHQQQQQQAQDDDDMGQNPYYQPPTGNPYYQQQQDDDDMGRNPYYGSGSAPAPPNPYYGSGSAPAPPNPYYGSGSDDMYSQGVSVRCPMAMTASPTSTTTPIPTATPAAGTMRWPTTMTTSWCERPEADAANSPSCFWIT